MTTNVKNDLQSRARHSWALLNRTFNAWSADNGSRMGAALAYYALFSLAPILLIAVAIAGSVFDDVSAREEVVKQVRYYVGTQGARAVRELMGSVTAVKSGLGGAVAGAAVLFFAASGLVTELQSALNEIWKTEPPPRPWLALIRRRVIALVFVFGSGFLLLLALILSTMVSVLGMYVSPILPMPAVVLHAVNLVLSFGVATLLLALIYKYLPDTRIGWRDVWVGAGATSVLLTLGNLVVGIFLSKSNITTTFGAAGSLLLVAVWIFYGAQLLYFGAEFTSVHAHERKLASAHDRSARGNTI